MNSIIMNLEKVHFEERVIGMYLTHLILIWSRSWLNRSRLCLVHDTTLYCSSHSKELQITLQMICRA